MNSQLELLNQWTIDSRMELNYSKSTVMWFKAFKNNQRAHYPPIMVNNVVLKVVTSQKYLGLVFDHNLSWDHHVSQICKKTFYCLHIIRCHRNVLGSKLLKRLTEVLVLSHLNYSLPVWGHFTTYSYHYKNSRGCSIGQCIFLGICTSMITSWSTTSIFSGFHWTLVYNIVLYARCIASFMECSVYHCNHLFCLVGITIII